MALRLVTSPVAEPVSLAEAKAHLKEDGDDNDTLIAGLIAAAREFYEIRTARALVARTYELVLDCFPGHEIMLPVSPLLSVDSVKYDDANGDEQTLAVDAYDVDTIREPGWLVRIDTTTWPVTARAINAVRITFTAGYEATTDSPPDPAGNVPKTAKQAILMLVGHWFENRETVSPQSMAEMPIAVEALINLKRVYI